MWLSAYMNFGTVSESESASIMAILNANNFTTLGCVTEINGVPYLETKSHYICYTSFVTRGQYQLFITGRLKLMMTGWSDSDTMEKSFPTCHLACLLASPRIYRTPKFLTRTMRN